MPETSDPSRKSAPPPKGTRLTALPTSEIVLRKSLVDALHHIAAKPRSSRARYVVALAIVVVAIALAATPAVRLAVVRWLAPRATPTTPNEESVAEALGDPSASAPSALAPSSSSPPPLGSAIVAAPVVVIPGPAAPSASSKTRPPRGSSR